MNAHDTSWVRICLFGVGSMVRLSWSTSTVFVGILGLLQAGMHRRVCMPDVLMCWSILRIRTPFCLLSFRVIVRQENLQSGFLCTFQARATSCILIQVYQLQLSQISVKMWKFPALLMEAQNRKCNGWTKEEIWFDTRRCSQTEATIWLYWWVLRSVFFFSHLVATVLFFFSFKPRNFCILHCSTERWRLQLPYCLLYKSPPVRDAPQHLAFSLAPRPCENKLKRMLRYLTHPFFWYMQSALHSKSVYLCMLFFKSAELENEGKYTCIATNSGGMKNHSVDFYVRGETIVQTDKCMRRVLCTLMFRSDSVSWTLDNSSTQLLSLSSVQLHWFIGRATRSSGEVPFWLLTKGWFFEWATFFSFFNQSEVAHPQNSSPENQALVSYQKSSSPSELVGLPVNQWSSSPNEPEALPKNQRLRTELRLRMGNRLRPLSKRTQIRTDSADKKSGFGWRTDQSDTHNCPFWKIGRERGSKKPRAQQKRNEQKQGL